MDGSVSCCVSGCGGTGSAQACGEVDTPDACEFAATTNGKTYSFNLATPISGYPQGSLNENGYSFLLETLLHLPNFRVLSRLRVLRRCQNSRIMHRSVSCNS